jgi:superfamily I DNA/RNA helicase
VKKADVQPSEIAMFVRSAAELDRAKAAAEKAALKFGVLDVETVPERLTISTMHLARGLEFRAVAVMRRRSNTLPTADRDGWRRS